MLHQLIGKLFKMGPELLYGDSASGQGEAGECAGSNRLHRLAVGRIHTTVVNQPGDDISLLNLRRRARLRTRSRTRADHRYQHPGPTQDRGIETGHGDGGEADAFPVPSLRKRRNIAAMPYLVFEGFHQQKQKKGYESTQYQTLKS